MKPLFAAAVCLALFAATVPRAAAGVVSQILALPAPDGIGFSGAPLQLPDGELVCTSASGGAHGLGVVVAVKPDGAVAWTHSFRGTDGARPVDGVMRADDGMLYGVASAGGKYHGGTIYRIDTEGRFNVYRNFTPSVGGEPNSPLVEAPGGVFYGTELAAPRGSATAYGAIYSFSHSAPLTVVHGFVGSDGSFPAGIALEGSGTLCGVAQSPEVVGATGETFGEVFALSIVSGSITVLHRFTLSQGQIEPGPPAVDEDGDAFVDTTPLSRSTTTYGAGLYEVEPNGITKLLGSLPTASWPIGAVARSTDDSLFLPIVDTSAGTTAVLRYSAKSGLRPIALLPGLSTQQFDLAQGSDGRLYAAQSSVSGTSGELLRLNRDDSLEALFVQAEPLGAGLTGGLVAGPTGLMYGATMFGGAAGFGDVYSLSPSGRFAVVHSFDGGSGGLPASPVVFDSRGNLYGTCIIGGPDGYGGVYRIDQTGTYKLIAAFDSPPIEPLSTPIVGPDGNIYGIGTSATNPGGFAYSLAASGGDLHHLFNFDAATGYPTTGVTFGPGGFLYGATDSGSTDNLGVVYRLSPSGAFEPFVRITQRIASVTSLVYASDGNLYGTSFLGQYGTGALFEVSGFGVLTVLHEFGSTGNGFPFGPLTQIGPGLLAGTESIYGQIYQISAEGVYSNLGTVSEAGLSQPTGTLCNVPGVGLFGIADSGGEGLGGVFKLAP